MKVEELHLIISFEISEKSAALPEPVEVLMGFFVVVF